MGIAAVLLFVLWLVHSGIPRFKHSPAMEIVRMNALRNKRFYQVVRHVRGLRSA